jgi:hypothetical protein
MIANYMYLFHFAPNPFGFRNGSNNLGNRNLVTSWVFHRHYALHPVWNRIAEDQRAAKRKKEQEKENRNAKRGRTGVSVF